MESRRLPIALALLAVALASPALQSGLLLDDCTHRLKLLGSRRFPEFFPPDGDMFTFWGHDTVQTERLMDAGLLPWWTYKGTKAAFWRPLAVLTHQLDYRLWPDVPLLMHAQSLLWFGAVVAAVTVLYRRLMGPVWVAGLAALLYAVDDAHGFPVAFIANRNALPCMLFGVLALLAHDAGRRSGWRFGALFGPLLLGLSLLSKEEGLAATAYLFAYALFLDRGVWKKRLAALLPYAGVVLAWRLVYTANGYGIWGLGPYVDPLAEPLRFAAAFVKHAPLFLLGQWALPPSEITIMLRPETVRLMWVAGVVCIVMLAIVFMPLLRRDKLARFYAVGMVLSLPPICATFPANRLLWFVGIGAMGLLAQFFASAFRQDDEQQVGDTRDERVAQPRQGRWGVATGGARRNPWIAEAKPESAPVGAEEAVLRVPPCAPPGLREHIRPDTHGLAPVATVHGPTGAAKEPPKVLQTRERPLHRMSRFLRVSLACILVFIHLLIAPLFLVYTAAFPMGPKAFQEQIFVRNPFDAAVEQQDLIIVNAPSAVCAVFLPVLREVEGGYIPRRTRPLATGADGVTIHRPHERTITLRPGRGYLAWLFDQLTRGPQFPMSVGERVELPGVTAEVLSLTDDGRPADVAFHFRVPLEDPSLRWLQWKDGAFIPFTPPPVGQTVHLPPAVPKLWPP